MKPASKSTRLRWPAFSLSLAFHVSLLASMMLLSWLAGRTLVERAPLQAIAALEIRGGSHPVPIELPTMDSAAHTRHPAPKTEATMSSTLPTALVRPVRPSGGGAPATPHTGNGSGTAAAGNGSDTHDAVPAFPVFSPRPPVTDRSLLPASERKIVVDVNVDAAGQVVKERLITGIGNKLDQIVLDIVKTWRFQPAMVDGKPVPTQAELIFPFDRNYPIADS